MIRNMNTKHRQYKYWVFYITILLIFPFSAKADLKLHFIDVGQGDAILVQCEGENMLIDAGPLEAGKTVHDYLTEKMGVTQLEYVVATHEHDDHLAGMPDALNGLIVQKIYTGKAISLNYWFETILPRVKGKSFSVFRPAEGETFKIGSATVSFIDTPKEAENANDLCLVLRIDYGNNSALLAADLEGDGENYLLHHDQHLQADVLKIGHHGGNTSTSEQFIRSVRPQMAIISVGTGNKHGHPHQEILNRLDKYNVIVYRTDLFGSIILTSDGNEWTTEVLKAR